MNSVYNLKYYLNVNKIGTVERNGGRTNESYPVTYEVSLVIHSKVGGHITFSFLDGVIESVLGVYQLTQINEVPPFDKVEPSVRNIAMFVRDSTEAVFREQGCELLSIEIGETPLSFYIYDARTGEEYRRVKTYLNISHAIEKDGVLGEAHEHSLEISCVVVGYESVEDCIVEATKFYQGKHLNDLHDFYKVNPTIENISLFFKKEISKRLGMNGRHLLSIEIAEKSTISYVC